MPLPIPPVDPQGLPLPVGLLKFILLAGFAIHILAVDIAVGGSILCLFHAIRGRRPGREVDQRLAVFIARILPPALTFVINFGIAPLLMLQLLYGQFFYVSSILMALPWIAVVFCIIGGYALLYRWTGGLEKAHVALPVGLGSAALLLTVGFMWTNNATLMLRPDAWSNHYAACTHGGCLNIGDLTVFPRYLHMVNAMIAVAGMALAVASLFLKPGTGGLDNAYARRVGLTWFAAATAIQFGIGIALLLIHPDDIVKAFLFGDVAASAKLWGAVGAAVVALLLARRGRDPATGKSGVLIPATLLGVTAIGMVLVRDTVRDLTLARAGFDVYDRVVATNWPVFALSVVAIVVYTFITWTMFRWLRLGPGAAVKKEA